MGATKEPIRLRRREMKTGNVSLYLDIYHNGKRSYEYLKLYLVPEKTRADKEKNRQTLQFAEAVRAKRVIELRNGEYGFKNDFAEDTLFFEYFRRICDYRRSTESRSNWNNWNACLTHLKRYEHNSKITFAEITPKWVVGFKDYLDGTLTYAHGRREKTNRKPLSKNTKSVYFFKLKACLQQAIDEGIIYQNPTAGIQCYRGEEGTRMYLTIDELRLLAQTECEYPQVKRAFLFSCLTGLRRSDVEKLTWGEVQQQGDFTRIIFKQKKTKGQEYLDISKQAAELMGERRKVGDCVFDDVMSPSCTNECIKRWVLRAGIQKHITFHCARHTFAVMMLDLGTDIYTVSKLLGHRELSTTQIYAKVLDKNKQAAVEKIPDIL